MKLQLRDSLTMPDRKRELNEALFSEIATSYDRVNQVLSFGRDRAWKRELIRSLPPLKNPHCLDLACGTGDLTVLLAAKYPEAIITGLDLTDAMLRVARARIQGPCIAFQQGDMCRMDFPDGSFDLVTGGYALRNAPDLEQALSEIHRVLKPGGVAAVLDLSKPPSRFFQTLENLALSLWGGLFGLALHGNPEIYRYLATSLRQFPDRRAFHKRLEKHGFREIESRLFFFGAMERVLFRKM